MDEIYIAITRLESLLANMMKTQNFIISDDIYNAKQRVDDICINQRYVKVCGCWYKENELGFYHTWNPEWQMDCVSHVKLALRELTYVLDQYDLFYYTRRQLKPPVNRTRCTVSK